MFGRDFGTRHHAIYIGVACNLGIQFWVLDLVFRVDHAQISPQTVTFVIVKSKISPFHQLYRH